MNKPRLVEMKHIKPWQQALFSLLLEQKSSSVRAFTKLASPPQPEFQCVERRARERSRQRHRAEKRW